MSSMRLPLFTRGLSGLSQSVEASSPAEQRDDAKRNFLKTMRPLPIQHYWNVYFDRQSKDHKPDAGECNVQLEQLGSQIESIQDFWRYNNTPVDQIKMRESIYLFKAGFKPVWEDRRNVDGGSWTFRVPRSAGPNVWTRIQLLAIGEKLQSALDHGLPWPSFPPPPPALVLIKGLAGYLGDQLCGVGLSVRFNSHLIAIWHRDSSKQKSIGGILACVQDELLPGLHLKADNYFYKRHRDHAGFEAPALDSHKSSLVQDATAAPTGHPQPEVRVDPPSAPSSAR